MQGGRTANLRTDGLVDDLAFLSLVCNAVPDAQVRFEVTWFSRAQPDHYYDKFCQRTPGDAGGGLHDTRPSWY